VEAGEQQALTGFADRLLAELGLATDAQGPAESELKPAEPRLSPVGGDDLSPEDEQLIALARDSLARIARALGAERSLTAPDIAIPALLNGAELVMRREVADGRSVSTLMPSFVFLISLPAVDQDTALDLSRRTASLLEQLLEG
jgi:hypothetical protein